MAASGQKWAEREESREQLNVGQPRRISKGIVYGSWWLVWKRGRYQSVRVSFQTSHSLRRKWLPVFWPVKRVVECWLFSLQRVLAQLQGNSEQLVFSRCPLWQMARSAPAPKVGPKFTELKMADFWSIRLIFCLSEREKRKESDRTSECRVLAVDFQGIGVNPPITLLNSVFTSTRVFGSPSHSRWKSLTEKLWSEARQSSWACCTFLCSKSLLRKSPSSLPSTSLLGISRGLRSWTVRSLRSSFFCSRRMDLRSVFLGLSSSVRTREALRGSSKSGKLMSRSACLRKAFCQILVCVMSRKSLQMSFCLAVTWSTNFWKPKLLCLGTKRKSCSLTSLTSRHRRLPKSRLYSDRITSSLRSSFVMPVSKILRMSPASRSFSRLISSRSRVSKWRKQVSTAWQQSMTASWLYFSSLSKCSANCSMLMVSWFDTPFRWLLSTPRRQSQHIWQFSSHPQSFPTNWQGLPCLKQLSAPRFILVINQSPVIQSELVTMQPTSQERVEFFHSESSFGSESSLSDSRYYDFTNEIIAETDNIFLTLKRELLPNESLLQQERMKFALSRAQLIHKDTIPEHLAYLRKIDAPLRAQQQVAGCAEKLGRLLQDYEKLRDGTMIYKQFYNLYGKEFGYQEGGFSRKKEIPPIEDEEALLKPECIQINYPDKQKLRATPRLFLPTPTPNHEKELASLREEIYALKRTVEEARKSHAAELNSEKINAEKRVRTYLQSNSAADDSALSVELRQTNQQLIAALEEVAGLKQVNSSQKKMIESITATNCSLQEQVELLRKMEQSSLEEQELNNKSYSSEVGEDKRMEKRLRNALQEKELLKNQLKNERERLYRLRTDLTDEEKRELDKNRRQLAAKTTELQELYANFDKQRVEILQLTHLAASAAKLSDSLKNENSQLKKQLEKAAQVDSAPPTLINFQAVDRSLEHSRSLAKCHIEQYEGEGIEGYPYYEILSKEFRIRYRRACLREKELLYKANGIEIGVISSFEQPNGLGFLIHLTNYGETRLERVRGKVMNPNGNRISQEVFEYAHLDPSEQVKIATLLQINYYPLGPLTFLLEYSTDAKQEIRILLPAHIFKTVVIEDRSDALRDPQTLDIATERKICKDLNDLKPYFKACKVVNGRLRAALYHKHTHTVVHMDLEQGKDGLTLQYEHVEGSSNITDYLVKTFTFLLAK